MFENIAAIDIGTSSIKVVTLKTGFKDFQLKEFVFEEIHTETENQAEAIQNAFTRVLEQEDLKGYQIITNLPMEKSIIRNISFPFSDVEKIAEAIPFEAEENIPFKYEDLTLDFQPLKSVTEGEGRVLLAATHKATMIDFLKIFHDNGLSPIRMGMESNALYECYRYFNSLEEETVIQIDIGKTKTILNIISNNNMLFTRSITIGLNQFYKKISVILNKSHAEAEKIFRGLNLNVTSLEYNIKRGSFKTLKIARPKFTQIFNAIHAIVEELTEQIILTTKAFLADFENVTFNRILISGGGANVDGIRSFISRFMDIPVVPLQFLPDHKEQEIQTQFPIAFGTALAYMNTKRYSVNFLKDEFTPDVTGASKKIYYLASSFAIFTVIILLLNLVISIIISSSKSSKDQQALLQKYKQYFRTSKISNDPLTDAKKLFKKESKEIKEITDIIPEDSSVLVLLKEITSNFPKDPEFELKSMVINKRNIRIDGTAGDKKNITTFKEKLDKITKFDSVTTNFRGKFFSMVIKFKK